MAHHAEGRAGIACPSPSPHSGFHEIYLGNYLHPVTRCKHNPKWKQSEVHGRKRDESRSKWTRVDSIEERPLYVTRVEVGGESRKWWKRIDLRTTVCNTASRPSPEDR